MKKIYLLVSVLIISYSFGQQNNNLYSISYKSLQNPVTLQYTNGIVRVAELNPITGYIDNIGLGTNTVAGNFTVDGGSVNQNNDTYNLIGNNSFMTFDINTGNFLQQTPITSFTNVGTTYFGQVRFNNSDNTLYGLARISTGVQQVSTYLAKLNTTTGSLIQLSQSPLVDQSVVSGNVIDPIQMIFYYCSPQKFVGLDLYNGNVYSSPNYVYSNPEYYGFGNIAFNCANNEIYGLIRGKYPSANAPAPTGYIYYMKLGKINPTTGVVTEISTNQLPSNAFSVGASSTIDESNNIYYFVGTGQIIYGISMVTGNVVSTAPATFEDGNTVFFLNSYNNCINRTAERQDPALLNNITFAGNDDIIIYPNPVSNILSIKNINSFDKVEIFDSNGRIVKISANEKDIDVEDLQSGIYFVKIQVDKKVKNQKFIKL